MQRDAAGTARRSRRSWIEHEGIRGGKNSSPSDVNNNLSGRSSAPVITFHRTWDRPLASRTGIGCGGSVCRWIRLISCLRPTRSVTVPRELRKPSLAAMIGFLSSAFLLCRWCCAFLLALLARVEYSLESYQRQLILSVVIILVLVTDTVVPFSWPALHFFYSVLVSLLSLW